MDRLNRDILFSELSSFRYRIKKHDGYVFFVVWIDILLLIGAFLYIDKKLGIDPGIEITLPYGKSITPRYTVKRLVMFNVNASSTSNVTPVVFFRDRRFILSDKSQKENLYNFLKLELENSEDPLLIEADGSLPYAIVTEIVNIAISSSRKSVFLKLRASK